jgi:hypothetical protein
MICGAFCYSSSEGKISCKIIHTVTKGHKNANLISPHGPESGDGSKSKRMKTTARRYIIEIV